MATINLDHSIVPAVVAPIAAVSTDVGIYIRYIGTQASATVEVAAGGDMTLKHGAAGAEAVDTGVGVAGVFDLSTPATYTNYGKLMDGINMSSNWRARLAGVQRSDLTDNTLITLSATQAKGVEVGCLRDTTVILTATVYAIGARLTHHSLLGGLDDGIINIITRIEGQGTSAGAHTLKVYSCNFLTQVDTLIWQAPLTSNTAYEFNDVDFGALGGLMSKPGESLLVQHQADTATITSPRMVINGCHKFLGASAVGRAAAISAQ